MPKQQAVRVLRPKFLAILLAIFVFKRQPDQPIIITSSDKEPGK